MYMHEKGRRPVAREEQLIIVGWRVSEEWWFQEGWEAAVTWGGRVVEPGLDLHR